MPKGNVRTAWIHWMCLNVANVEGERVEVRPLRKIKMNAKGNAEVLKIGKRISELRKLMLPLEARAKGAATWKEIPTMEEAIQMFDEADLVTKLPPSKKRKRNDQISWTTLAKNSYENKEN